jgi:receptor protein-tyrosine kinase
MAAAGEKTSATPSTDWLSPPEDQEGLSAYVETLRERFVVVIVTFSLVMTGAILYVLTADDVYKAGADVLVSPVPASAGSPSLGVPFIRESSDPTRDVETAARLITTTAVAERVKRELNSDATTGDLLDDVTATPVAQSQLVDVTGKADSAQDAADLANAFAIEAVAERSAQLKAIVDRQAEALQSQFGENSAVTRDLAVLERIAGSSELQVANPAASPSQPASPRRKLSLAAAAIAGLILGVALAFAWNAIDPRLRREEQLRRRYRLPILGRVPQQARFGSGPLAPKSLTAATSEAFRTLRGTLTGATRAGTNRSILVTGSSPSEGKTTTAINLASALAAGGKNVILIEGDLRKPTIGQSLGVAPRHGLVSVLMESVAIEDALIPTETFGPRLRLLLADYSGDWISELFTLPVAQQLVDDASELADFVIIDSPPLADVIDVLPLARYVDDVLVVARLGHTRLKKLAELADLLAENDIKPAGFALVGTARPSKSSYQYYVARGEPLARPGGGAIEPVYGSNGEADGGGAGDPTLSPPRSSF